MKLLQMEFFKRFP